MRVFRVPQFLGAALMLGLLARCCASCRGACDDRLHFDVAHLLAGSLVLVSFMLFTRTGSMRC